MVKDLIQGKQRAESIDWFEPPVSSVRIQLSRGLLFYAILHIQCTDKSNTLVQDHINFVLSIEQCYCPSASPSELSAAIDKEYCRSSLRYTAAVARLKYLPYLIVAAAWEEVIVTWASPDQSAAGGGRGASI